MTVKSKNMKIEKRKLTELSHPPKNVRMHTDKQLTEFCRSVKMFGQIRPIVIDEKNTILAGNGLFEALKTLEYETADCYVVAGLSENEKKKLMLADNRIFNLGVDDLAAFDDILAELGDDLDVPGYDEDLLQTLVASSEDVDGLMADYGKIDDDKKEEILEAHTVYEKENERISEEKASEAAPQSSAPPSHSSQDDNAETEQPQEVRKFVVCPKCGEKIWL